MPIHIVINLVVDKVSLSGVVRSLELGRRGVRSVVRNWGVNCFVDIRVGFGRVGVCRVRIMADMLDYTQYTQM
jgi:hypothetical protein